MNDRLFKNKLMGRFIGFWFETTDTIRLDTFRMCLGISILLYMGFRWQYADEWLTREGFHISAQNLPFLSMKVPLLPLLFLPIFGAFFFASILALIVGWQTRWAIWSVWGCLLYVTCADQLAAFSPNKILLAVLFILGFAPFGTYWSVSKGQPQRQPVWPVRVFQITMIVHFFMAGWAKVVFGEWMTNPLVLWTQMHGTYRTHFAGFLLNLLSPKVWTFMQINALLVELLSPFLFISKKLRWLGFLWMGSLLIMIALTMKHLIYFMLIIASFFVLFVEEDALHRFRKSINVFSVKRAFEKPER